jgi:hypothetical protein
MSAELPALSAVVARLPQPEINLAAYGGVVFPLALIIESPIIMLLAASTTLSKDAPSYRLVYRWMMTTSASLTGLHLLVAFSPIFDWIAIKILAAPVEIIEPARLGLQIMFPWTWSIAYRRFHQGVLIRFGRSNAVTTGTVIRLTVDLLVLGLGYAFKLPGIVTATLAVACSVISEALYIGIVVRPVLSGPLAAAQPVNPPLSSVSFLRFYFPLVLTSLLTLIANPIISASINRMPDTLPSLAAWPVVSGLLFAFRALGIALNEVVVALLDEPGAARVLRRFTHYLAVGTFLGLVLIVITPLANLWFVNVSALAPGLASLARNSLWFTLLLPPMSALQSWYQGNILFGRNTRPITESVALYLVSNIIFLFVAVQWSRYPGIYAGLTCMLLSTLAQTAWLWYRSRPILRTLLDRDAA